MAFSSPFSVFGVTFLHSAYTVVPCRTQLSHLICLRQFWCTCVHAPHTSTLLGNVLVLLTHHTLRVVASYALYVPQGFHGSPVENWHAIMRTGLRNASGTNLQLNGAAKGKGIYISTLASTSFNYSKILPLQLGIDTAACNRFIPRAGGRGIAMVAICEVINHPSVRRHHQVWVVPDESHVCARFFLVYTKRASAAVMSVVTTTPKIVDEIQRAMGFAGCAGSETGGQGKP